MGHNPKIGTYKWQNITRDTVLLAISKTKTNLQAARYIGVTKATWKKYASLYTNDDGTNCYESHNNKYCVGVHRKSILKETNTQVLDILNGKTPPTNYDPIALKRKIIAEGYLKEECSRCGFDEKRESDFKVPVLMVFRDGNKKNWDIDNITLYCHNCYFLNIGDVYTKKKQEYIEGIKNAQHVNLNETLELSHSHMKALEDILTNKLQRDPGRGEISPDDLIDHY